jgi:ribosomal protein S18 acetylase RimI-like enzyme
MKMSIRPIKYPDDLDILPSLTKETFQYPENEAGGLNIQDDDLESMADNIRSLKRMWPLIRLLGWFYRPLRSPLGGFFWEDDGQPKAMVETQVAGISRSNAAWQINTVGVSPGYRRRGIARQLVLAAIDDIRKKNMKTITLNVLSNNVPAIRLYESVGFEQYGGTDTLEYDPKGTLPAKISLPEGYAIGEASYRDWQARYELARRVAPTTTQKYRPVSEGDFRVSWLLRPLHALFSRFGSSIQKTFLVRHETSNTAVAEASYSARKKAGGVNYLSVKLDPAHADLAADLVNMLVHEVAEVSPGHRIEVVVPTQQDAVIAALKVFGFTPTQGCPRLSMGLVL